MIILPLTTHGEDGHGEILTQPPGDNYRNPIFTTVLTVKKIL